MAGTLITIALIGFLVGLLAMIKGNVKLLKIRSRGMGAVVVLVSLVTLILGGALMPDDEQAGAPLPPSVQPLGLPLGEYVEYAVIETMGETSNIDKRDRLIEIEFRDASVQYLVSVLGDSNLTTNMTRRGMQNKAKDFFEKVFEHKDTKSVRLEFYMPLVDSFGNVEDDVVMVVYLTKETHEKINWDNKLTIEIDKIADHYWTHPAIN